MLTDTKARQAKPASTPYKLADQGGLYLYVSTTGAKSWRYDYRLSGKRETVTLGSYPNTTLAEVRSLHAEARRLIAKGMSPAQGKRQQKESRADTFQALAEEWYAALSIHRSESWRALTRRWLTKELYPAIGSKPVRSVTPTDILAVMRRLEKEGVLRTANYVRQTASRVFQHAIRNLRADYDPAQSLRGAVIQPKPKHYAALIAKDIPGFLDAVDAYPGQLATKIAVKLLLLTVVRKGELLGATWGEVDFERAEWRVPAERMKTKQLYVVPLSRQALECFQALKPLACGSRYVFPSIGDLGRPMGHSTLNKAFGRMGYRGRLTVHGLRATASTVLNEQGIRADIIERQLAHAERNRIRAAYNRAEYLEERRAMMQHWADFVDGLCSGGTVVPFKAAR